MSCLVQRIPEKVPSLRALIQILLSQLFRTLKMLSCLPFCWIKSPLDVYLIFVIKFFLNVLKTERVDAWIIN